MRNLLLLYKFSPKEFLNINKIIEFSKNLSKLPKETNIKMCFYGNNSVENFSTFMSFFNLLVNKKVCDLSYSINNSCLVIENGVNNKSLKKSISNAKKTTVKEIFKTIASYYQDYGNLEIITMPNKDWATTILNFL